jgi:GT2 family glycosyltransferase
VWLPNLLTVHIGYLLGHPELGYTICTGRTFLEEGVARPGWIEPRQLEEDQAFLGSQVLRRSVFDRVGLLDPRYRYAEDNDWVNRADEAGIARAILPEPVFRRRIHTGNVSHNWREASTQLLRSTRAAMLRRRGRGAGSGPREPGP